MAFLGGSGGGGASSGGEGSGSGGSGGSGMSLVEQMARAVGLPPDLPLDALKAKLAESEQKRLALERTVALRATVSPQPITTKYCTLRMHRLQAMQRALYISFACHSFLLKLLHCIAFHPQRCVAGLHIYV